MALRWLTQNPGRQLLTSSFHPVEDDQWADPARWHVAELDKGATFESLFYLLAGKKQRQAAAGLSALLQTRGVAFSLPLSNLVCQVR